MKIPLIVWIAVWAQGVPLLAALARPRLLRGARGFVAVWLVLLLLMDGTAWAWSYVLHRPNNHIISYAFMPFQSASILSAIALWHVRPVLRLTTWLCIPLLLVWWFLNIFFFEDTANFSLFGSPVYSLIALAAALLALSTRALVEESPLLQQDWVWMLMGLAIYFATNATVTIVQGAALAAADYGLVDRAHRLKAVIDLIAFLVLTGGFLCPHPRASFGESSSPDRSPSPSSSSRSSPPS